MAFPLLARPSRAVVMDVSGRYKPCSPGTAPRWVLSVSVRLYVFALRCRASRMVFSWLQMFWNSLHQLVRDCRNLTAASPVHAVPSEAISPSMLLSEVLDVPSADWKFCSARCIPGVVTEVNPDTAHSGERWDNG